MKKRNLGLTAAVGSYLLWGLLPVYWKQLSAVSAYEILSHRIIWSFFFMLMILSFMGRMVSFWEECKHLWADKSRGALLALASFLITANWCIFIWAVTNRHVVDTSVGYYMNPLVSVLLGVVCFHERLSKMKWFSIAVAAAGISVMTWELGRFPLIAVGLASTFALYGAVKKKLNLDAFYSITLETFFVLPFALAYVLSLGNGGIGHFNVDDLPLNVLGFCQYISPSITLLLGIFLFGEPFTRAQLSAFSFIWSALAVFTIADWRERKFLEKRGMSAL